MILYNCHHSGDQYRITKFDSDMSVVSSYLCSLEECDCPRGSHPTCRHRQMLPKFIAQQHIGDEWFLDFDRGGWVQMGPAWAQQEGVTMITLNHPDKVVDVHSAIADAVSEPITTERLDVVQFGRVLHERPPSPTHIKRRL